MREFTPQILTVVSCCFFSSASVGNVGETQPARSTIATHHIDRGGDPWGIAFDPATGDLYVATVEWNVNAWNLLAWYWPWYAAPLFLITGVFLGRQWRRWQKQRRIDDREPRCASCGYQLTALTSDRCPECGASTHARNRVIGKPHVRRLVGVTGLWFVMAAISFTLYYQSGPLLARDWFNWPSRHLANLGRDRGWIWLTRHSVFRSHVRSVPAEMPGTWRHAITFDRTNIIWIWVDEDRPRLYTLDVMMNLYIVDTHTWRTVYEPQGTAGFSFVASNFFPEPGTDDVYYLTKHGGIQRDDPSTVASLPQPPTGSPAPMPPTSLQSVALQGFPSLPQRHGHVPFVSRAVGAIDVNRYIWAIFNGRRIMVWPTNDYNPQPVADFLVQGGDIWRLTSTGDQPQRTFIATYHPSQASAPAEEWDAYTGTLVRTIAAPNRNGISTLTLSPEGRYLYVITDGRHHTQSLPLHITSPGSLLILDTHTNQWLGECDITSLNAVQEISVNFTGDKIAVLGQDASGYVVLIFDTSDLSQPHP